MAIVPLINQIIERIAIIAYGSTNSREYVIRMQTNSGPAYYSVLNWCSIPQDGMIFDWRQELKPHHALFAPAQRGVDG